MTVGYAKCLLRPLPPQPDSPLGPQLGDRAGWSTAHLCPWRHPRPAAPALGQGGCCLLLPLPRAPWGGSGDSRAAAKAIATKEKAVRGACVRPDPDDSSCPRLCVIDFPQGATYYWPSMFQKPQWTRTGSGSPYPAWSSPPSSLPPGCPQCEGPLEAPV